MSLDHSAFAALALKVAAQEATAEEEKDLHAELASSPERQAEFAELQESLELVRPHMAAVAALQAPEIPFPAWRRQELDAAVKAQFGAPVRPLTRRQARPWWRKFASSLVAVAALIIMTVYCSMTMKPEAGMVIEYGYYDDLVVRGATNAPEPVKPVTPPSSIQAKKLASEKAFDDWRTAPLPPHVAKVWIDDDTHFLHAITRGEDGSLQEVLQPLPAGQTPTAEQWKRIVEKVTPVVK